MGKSDLFYALRPVVLLFARLSGFFLISPLFSGKSLSVVIRLGCALACSLILAPSLLQNSSDTIDSSLLFILHVLKEVAIGYLIGFLFSLLFEAAAFAGQLIGTLMGFSATELFDPLVSSYHPLLARFFSLLIFSLFLTLDLHHPLLRLLYDSFEIIPLNYPFLELTIFGFIKMSNSMFHYALEWSIFPLTLLLSLIAIFALLSRFFSIFWIGFPLQLIVGLTAIGASLHFFCSYS